MKEDINAIYPTTKADYVDTDGYYSIKKLPKGLFKIMDKQFYAEKYASFIEEVKLKNITDCAFAIRKISAQCNYEIAEYIVKCLTEKYALHCCDKRVALTDQYETYREASKWFRENVAVKLDTDIRNILIYGKQ